MDFHGNFSSEVITTRFRLLSRLTPALKTSSCKAKEPPLFGFKGTITTLQYHQKRIPTTGMKSSINFSSQHIASLAIPHPGHAKRLVLHLLHFRNCCRFQNCRLHRLPAVGLCNIQVASRLHRMFQPMFQHVSAIFSQCFMFHRLDGPRERSFVEEYRCLGVQCFCG